MGETAKAGAHIVDVAIGSSVRWYGQGDVLATAAYIEEEMGLKSVLDKDMIRTTTNCAQAGHALLRRVLLALLPGH